MLTKGRHWSAKKIEILPKKTIKLVNADLTGNILDLVCHNESQPETSEISTPSEIAVGTHFDAQYGTKTTLVFLSDDGETSWSLLPSLVSLLSCSTVQPENTYSSILKVTGQV